MAGNPQRSVYLGLGGNVGDVFANMVLALQMLDHLAQTSVVSVSGIYKTPPWGLEEQDWFLNACVEIRTSLAANTLLTYCQEIEKSLKREKTVRWGPRTLDIDILAIDGEVITGEYLTVPHPRMLLREFVMRPLCDIAPDLIISDKTCSEWLSKIEERTAQKLDVELDWKQP